MARRMSATRLFTIVLFCVLTSINEIGAQQHILPVPLQGDSAMSVSLLTCSPGSQIYELEGHSALRLQYAGYDITVNWGLFDFATPNFVYRFVKGETDYCVGATDTRWFLEQYRQQGRRVTQQRLALTEDEAVKLISFIDQNLRPENRVYRYNYIRDNCATRPVKIIEKAVGAKIEFHTTFAELGSDPSWRSEMRLFHRNYPWYQFGIDIALGSELDERIAPDLTIFAPVVLSDMIGHATITTDGQSRPLVSSTEILVDGPAEAPVEDPTSWYATPLSVALLLLAVTIIISVLDIKRNIRARWLDAILFGLMGLAGCVVAFLVFVSSHAATSPNWLLLWLTPLALIGAAFQWWGKTASAVRLYHVYNVVATLLLTVIFLIGWQIANTAFYPLMAAGLIRSIINIKKSNGLKK